MNRLVQPWSAVAVVTLLIAPVWYRWVNAQEGDRIPTGYEIVAAIDAMNVSDERRVELAESLLGSAAGGDRYRGLVVLTSISDPERIDERVAMYERFMNDEDDMVRALAAAYYLAKADVSDADCAQQHPMGREADVMNMSWHVAITSDAAELSNASNHSHPLIRCIAVRRAGVLLKGVESADGSPELSKICRTVLSVAVSDFHVAVRAAAIQQLRGQARAPSNRSGLRAACRDNRETVWLEEIAGTEGWNDVVAQTFEVACDPWLAVWISQMVTRRCPLLSDSGDMLRDVPRIDTRYMIGRSAAGLLITSEGAKEVGYLEDVADACNDKELRVQLMMTLEAFRTGNQ